MKEAENEQTKHIRPPPTIQRLESRRTAKQAAHPEASCRSKHALSATGLPALGVSYHCPKAAAPWAADLPARYQPVTLSTHSKHLVA